MLRVAAFGGGRNVPSARFRVRQYIDVLGKFGMQVDEMPCRFGKYPPRGNFARPFWLAGVLCEQAANYVKLKDYDVVLLQREIVSKLITFERFLAGPAVVDVDDAIFLYRGGYLGRRLAECAAVVVCGNAYLAEWFSKWNGNVRVIPTAVDTERYRPVVRSAIPEEVVIGWIGTSVNLPELATIEGPLQTVLTRFRNARLRVVCDLPPYLPALNEKQVEYIPWEEGSEVEHIQGMDIGVMPLRDTPWTRGKCSFKLIQYMACGLPSVVSAVGMNIEVASMRGCSRAVRTEDEWVDALTDLVSSMGSRQAMGTVARDVAERAFSVHALAPQLADAIKQARIGNGRNEVEPKHRPGADAGCGSLRTR